MNTIPHVLLNPEESMTKAYDKMDAALADPNWKVSLPVSMELPPKSISTAEIDAFLVFHKVEWRDIYVDLGYNAKTVQTLGSKQQFILKLSYIYVHYYGEFIAYHNGKKREEKKETRAPNQASLEVDTSLVTAPPFTEKEVDTTSEATLYTYVTDETTGRKIFKWTEPDLFQSLYQKGMSSKRPINAWVSWTLVTSPEFIENSIIFQKASPYKGKENLHLFLTRQRKQNGAYEAVFQDLDEVEFEKMKAGYLKENRNTPLSDLMFVAKDSDREYVRQKTRLDQARRIVEAANSPMTKEVEEEKENRKVNQDMQRKKDNQMIRRQNFLYGLKFNFSFPNEKEPHRMMDLSYLPHTIVQQLPLYLRKRGVIWEHEFPDEFEGLIEIAMNNTDASHQCPPLFQRFSSDDVIYKESLF